LARAERACAAEARGETIPTPEAEEGEDAAEREREEKEEDNRAEAILAAALAKQAAKKKPLAPAPAGAAAATSSAPAPAAKSVPLSPAAPPPQTGKYRHQWYQTPSHVFVDVLAKGHPPESALYAFGERSFKIELYDPKTRKSEFKLFFKLAGKIDRSECHVSFLPTKIEIKMKKAEQGVHWPGLEDAPGTTAAPPPPPPAPVAAPVVAAPPPAPAPRLLDPAEAAAATTSK
jgi:hypothetical protein